MDSEAGGTSVLTAWPSSAAAASDSASPAAAVVAVVVDQTTVMTEGVEPLVQVCLTQMQTAVAVKTFNRKPAHYYH